MDNESANGDVRGIRAEIFVLKSFKRKCAKTLSPENSLANNSAVKVNASLKVLSVASKTQHHYGGCR